MLIIGPRKDHRRNRQNRRYGREVLGSPGPDLLFILGVLEVLILFSEHPLWVVTSHSQISFWKIFCAKIERVFLKNSVKVGLQSTSNIGSGSLPILVVPAPFHKYTILQLRLRVKRLTLKQSAPCCALPSNLVSQPIKP